MPGIETHRKLCNHVQQSNSISSGVENHSTSLRVMRAKMMDSKLSAVTGEQQRLGNHEVSSCSSNSTCFETIGEIQAICALQMELH